LGREEDVKRKRLHGVCAPRQVRAFLNRDERYDDLELPASTFSLGRRADSNEHPNWTIETVHGGPGTLALEKSRAIHNLLTVRARV